MSILTVLSSRIYVFCVSLIVFVGTGCAYRKHQICTNQQNTNLSAARNGVEKAFSSSLLNKTASLCIAFHDDIVVDKPFEDGGDPKADLMSVTKSIAALAVGCAVDEGLFDGIDRPLMIQTPQLLSEGHEGLTLRHLMTMTAGLTKAGQTNEKEVYAARSSVELARSCRQNVTPGTRWDYDNRALALIVGALKAASFDPLQHYTQSRLFAVLGINEWEWQQDLAGDPYLMAGLSLSTRNLVKFGQLIANRGVWHGQRVLSSGWVDELSRTTPTLADTGYGLLWWVGLPRCFWSKEDSSFDNILWAQGYAHQYLFVDQVSHTVIAILNRPPDDNGSPVNDEEKSNDIFRGVVQLISARRANVRAHPHSDI